MLLARGVGGPCLSDMAGMCSLPALTWIRRTVGSTGTAPGLCSFHDFVPVARSLISLPAGVTRMPLIPFILLTFVGSFIWSLGLAYAGYQLGDNWESIRDVMRPVEIPILIVVVLLVAYYVYRHVRQLRSGLKDSREAETERHVP